MLRSGVYRHFKGNLYEVLGVAQHSETQEYLVVYRPLEDRYTLLETIRQYLIDRSVADGTLDERRARHLDYFVALADTAKLTKMREDLRRQVRFTLPAWEASA